VDQLGGPAAGAGREVAGFDEGDSAAGDAAADDEQVELA